MDVVQDGMGWVGSGDNFLSGWNENTNRQCEVTIGAKYMQDPCGVCTQSMATEQGPMLA